MGEIRFCIRACLAEQKGSWVWVHVRNLHEPKGSHRSEKYSAISINVRSNTENDAIPGVSMIKVSLSIAIREEKVVVWRPF